MKWSIEYYNSGVEEDVFSLPKNIVARYIRMMDLMICLGPNLGMPHARSLGGKLIELRVKGKEGIARIFYCKKMGYRIMVLHCFVKKSQKIPKKELDIARKRLREMVCNE